MLAALRDLEVTGLFLRVPGSTCDVRYNADSTTRLLLHWIETVHAKGYDIWRDPAWEDLALLLSQVRKWLQYLEDEDHEETEDIRQLHASDLPAHGRRFGITARDHFCLPPRYTKANDPIYIPYGSKVQFGLRPGEVALQNIGECYVHGAYSKFRLGIVLSRCGTLR